MNTNAKKTTDTKIRELERENIKKHS